MIGARCTLVGRIVYDAEPTPWRWRDLRRVSRAISDRDMIPELDELAVAVDIWIRVTLLIQERIIRSAIATGELPRAVLGATIPSILPVAIDFLIAMAREARAAVRRAITEGLKSIPLFQ